MATTPTFARQAALMFTDLAVLVDHYTSMDKTQLSIDVLAQSIVIDKADLTIKVVPKVDPAEHYADTLGIVEDLFELEGDETYLLAEFIQSATFQEHPIFGFMWGE